MIKPTGTDDVAVAIELDLVVEEIVGELWAKGARLYDLEFYSRYIPPLQDAFGPAPVAAALRRHQAMLRRQASDHIRGLRRNAAWLRRNTRGGR
jgi:hypothetical protein